MILNKTHEKIRSAKQSVFLEEKINEYFKS